MRVDRRASLRPTAARRTRAGMPWPCQSVMRRWRRSWGVMRDPGRDARLGHDFLHFSDGMTDVERPHEERPVARSSGGQASRRRLKRSPQVRASARRGGHGAAVEAHTIGHLDHDRGIVATTLDRDQLRLLMAIRVLEDAEPGLTIWIWVGALVCTVRAECSAGRPRPEVRLLPGPWSITPCKSAYLRATPSVKPQFGSSREIRLFSAGCR